ncbi:eCIS core domain-containing protein [Bradyrhizobium sp. 930_D9_N1_4]|uniref:eCIS core domain-containing protein n=1 Tax=Bradyrhizobium sp. 930_D9_N1_4 TaxID=3240374 RepID=UPI003F8BF6E7
MKTFAPKPARPQQASPHFQQSKAATPLSGHSDRSASELRTNSPPEQAPAQRADGDFSRIPLHAVPGTTPAQDRADTSNLRESYLKGDHQRAVSIVRSGKGAGRPLASDVHDRMKAHLGRDFSQVRIHNDAFAGRAASSLEANAFTVRGDIFFGANMYAPGQPRGLRRLAHELAHTLQQHDTAPPPTAREIDAIERQAEHAASLGIHGGAQLLAAGLCVLREPTQPRATTADDMEKEVRRVLALKRDTKSKDETTRLWSQVTSNFPKGETAGSLARKTWTNIFLKHFVEPDQTEGVVESAHARYFFSRKYGWVDAQHFYGFIDFAEQFHRGNPKKLEKAFKKSTEKGLSIEQTQWTVNQLMDRDPSTMDYKDADDWKKKEDKRDRDLIGARHNVLTEMASPFEGMLDVQNPVIELLMLLDDKQKEKFWIDMAKSAFTYEDFESNQLGTRFYFKYGIKINGLPEGKRAAAFEADLHAFFKEIEVENDPKVVAEQAKSLPGKERFNAPKTTEDKVRKQYPDLFKLP